MKNGKKLIWISLLFFLLFAAFTAIVMTVDVQRIGPEETSVGLATFNGAYAKTVGYRDGWYRLSELTGTLSLLTAAAFSLWTLIQMIRRRGIFRAEKRLLLLLGFYALVAVIYVLFDHLVINYRPVILDEGLELSYPSSHTLLAMCVMGTAAVQLGVRFAERKAIRNLTVCTCVLLLVLTVVGRALSGVHWLTDIIGSILLSAALVFLYVGLLAYLERDGMEKG
ncbi:MAG: phosphatase PAP2 family protein [Oscillospiraceae bacterium]|nr:phosphatase PAP2 family protein [Oscillospiraceae bacterium]